MAAARPLVGRASVAENVIKQGYLKKSVRSSDPIPSTTKQIATNIKQKLEPSRWYVFGVRFGHPYLEYFESEEKVFTSRPVEIYDLSTYRNLTYTLGRTNTNFTFCIFLELTTIELTAQNRAQMLDWCRCLERNLRNLGIGNKKARDDHTYSAFPVQPKPPTKSSFDDDLDGLEGATAIGVDDTEQENLYEDADDVKNLRKDENDNNRSSPPLPPRPRKSDEDEDVFASIYSVHKLPDNEYNNVRNGEVLLDDDLDEEELGESTLKASEYSLSENVLKRNAWQKFENDHGEEDDERCSSMPVIPSKVQESDTSEDSDFVSASFWLRNRKKADLKTFDDSAIDVVKRKLPNVSANNVPPLPLRVQSMRTNSRRNCVSLYASGQDLEVEGSLVTATMDQKPVPKPRKTPPNTLKSEREKDLTQADGSERCPVKPTSDSQLARGDYVMNSDDKIFGKSVDKLGGSENSDTEDGYEALVNTAKSHKVPKPEVDTIYETTWGSSMSGESSTRNKCNTDDVHVKETNTGKKDEDMPLVPPKRKGFSKIFPKRSVKDKPLPETLVVSLPPRPGAAKAAKGNPDSEEEEDNTPIDGNLYSDFPDAFGKGSSESGGARSKNVDTDSKVLKTASTSDTKCGKQTSPVLPKRNLSSSVSNSKQVPSEYVAMSKNLSHSFSETRSKTYAKSAGTDLYDTCNGSHSSPPSPTGLSHENNDSSMYVAPSSVPVAPPRRNRRTGQGPNVNYSSEHGKHKTVISNQPTSYELASTLPIRDKGLSTISAGNDDPPLPPRVDSLRPAAPSPSKTGTHEQPAPPLPSVASIPERSAHPLHSKAGLPGRPTPLLPSVLSTPERPAPPLPSRHSPTERPALPLPTEDCPPDRPAPPPPVARRGMSRSQSDAEKSEGCPPPTGPRPRTAYMVSRQPSQLGMNLKQNQVDVLKAERDSIGGMVRTLPKVHFQNGLALVQCFDRIWIAGWDVKKYPRLFDKFHIGDELISVNDVQLVDLQFAYKLVKNIKADHLEVTVRRLPTARIFAIQRSRKVKVLIVYVDPNGLAAKHGLSAKATTMSGGGLCTWTLTEINMRPLNLFFKDMEIEHRLLAVGRDISIVVQPTDFIKELKKQLKKVRSFKDFIVQ